MAGWQMTLRDAVSERAVRGKVVDAGDLVGIVGGSRQACV